MKFCEGCGIPFEYAVYVDEQELAHWEEESDEALASLSETQKHELYEIFSNETEDYQDRLEKLAERVLNNTQEALTLAY